MNTKFDRGLQVKEGSSKRAEDEVVIWVEVVYINEDRAVKEWVYHIGTPVMHLERAENKYGNVIFIHL